MQKYIALFGLLLLITAGCTAQDQETNNNLQNSANTPTNESSPEQQLNVYNQNNMPAQPLPPNQQPDLLENYSQATLNTNYGPITVEFYSQDSPTTVNNFLYLAQEGYYDNTQFHRVIKDFMIQGGDPLSKDDNPYNDGQGGPGYQFADEINDHKLVQGSLAMANAGADTNGSQFFIVTADSTPWLDGAHTNFGQVVSGMDVVNQIENVATDGRDHPQEAVIIESIELK